MNAFARPDAKATYTSFRFVREAHPRELFVVVEGDTDRNLLASKVFRQHPKAQILVAGNKINALRVERLSRELISLAPVIFVVDADYDRHMGKSEQSDVVVYTDANDMECTILSIDDVLERTEHELMPRSVISQLLTDTGYRTLRDLVISRAAHVGRYRLTNATRELGLSFKDLPYSVVFEPPRFSWCDSVFRDWMRDKNAAQASRVDQLFAAVDETAWGGDDLNVCRGHDLLEVLSIIQKHFAPAHGYNCWESRLLESILRVAVDESRLRATRMVQRLLGTDP